MGRITQAQVEKAIRHAQDRERAFKEQERRAESRKKVILGGLIILAARNIEKDGLPRDKAISFFRFLASPSFSIRLRVAAVTPACRSSDRRRIPPAARRSRAVSRWVRRLSM